MVSGPVLSIAKRVEPSRRNGQMEREALDLLRSRVELLDGKDKVLVTMYLENGASFRQLAKLTGISETTVARRIRRLTNRLIDGAYIACLRNRDMLNEMEMAVAKDYFLYGLSMRKIALSRRCSVYGIFKTLVWIKRLLAADSGQGADRVSI